MTAYYKQQVLPETGRFNWKNGFYSPEKMEEFRSANERAAAEKAAIAIAKKRGSFGKGRVSLPEGDFRNRNDIHDKSRSRSRVGGASSKPRGEYNSRSDYSSSREYSGRSDYNSSRSDSYSSHSENFNPRSSERTSGKQKGKNGSRFIPDRKKTGGGRRGN